MGVLAVSRYLFELTVWLKLLQKDNQHGLIHYYELLKKQRDFYTALQKHSKREVAYLIEIEKAEQHLLESTVRAAMRIPEKPEREAALRKASTEVRLKIDEDAARKFSLYAEQAQTNGYGFQAYLLDTKIIPSHSEAVRQIERELDGFESRLAPSVKALIPKRWNWKEQAEKVDMGEEYEFIYIYTSLLMHATPVSITTDQKNLECEEVRMFLRYIRVRIFDAIRLAEDFLAENQAFVQE